MSRLKISPTAIILFCLFCLLYLIYGLMLAKTKVFWASDVFFQIDAPRVIEDMVLPGGDHYRTKVHPLFVLLLNPVGTFLKLFFGPITSSVLLTSVAGALSVALCYLFLKKVGLEKFNATIFSLIYGFSTTNVFFGSVPETYIFSSLSIVLLFYIIVNDSNIKMKHYLPASIFSIGILTTNLVTSIIVYFSTGPIIVSKLVRWMKFVLLLVLSMVILSFIQKWIYPSSVPFYLPEAYVEDKSYLHFVIGMKQILSVLKHFFLYNFLAPNFITWYTKDYPLPWMSFYEHSPALKYSHGPLSPVFWLGAALWSIILAMAARNFFFVQKKNKPLIYGLLVSLAYNFVFFLVYGDDIFLYSGSWNFIVLALVAILFQCVSRFKKLSLLTGTITVGFLFIQIWNNSFIFYRIFSLYSAIKLY